MSGHPLSADAAHNNRRLPTNHYPGCECPHTRYNPATGPKPTNPHCPLHGGQQ